MFSHVTVGVSDLARAGRFYDALLQPLGLRQRQTQPDGGPPSLCWVRAGTSLPRFFAYMPFNGRPPSPGNGAMVAFLAETSEQVDQAHAAGLAAGGSDEG
ncbi:VOC family protein, partial [Bordetella pertussis]